MSSVGSSDSADRGGDKNLLRRAREESRQRESDLIKRHNVEQRRVNERHEDELERVKSQHTEQMHAMKEHAGETFSARDQKYQRDIDDIRNMHRKQLQSVADENQRRDEVTKKSVVGDAKQRERYNEERFGALTEGFDAETKRMADDYATRGREIKDAQSTAITRLRDGLNRRHELELEALRDTLGTKLAENEKKFGEYRREVDQERRDGRVRTLKTARDAGENLMDAVRGERENRRQSESQLRDDYRETLAGERRRFDEALDAQAEAEKNARLEFRANHDDRDSNRIGALEQENRHLREKGVRDEQKLRHQAGQELRHAKRAFQDNVEAYRLERDEAYRRTNQGESDDFRREREKLENRLVDSTRESRDKLNAQGRQSRVALEHLRGDFDARQEQTELVADARVGQILEKMNDEKARLVENERLNHATTQRQKHDEIKALRDVFEDDKQSAVENMRDTMRKQELRHQERMGVVVGKYDKQVQSLKDDLLRERKSNAENTKRLTEELGRAHQRELDQADAKSRAKLAELNVRHEQDVRDVTRRYEEKLDQVFSEVKKTQT